MAFGGCLSDWFEVPTREWCTIKSCLFFIEYGIRGLVPTAADDRNAPGYCACREPN
jgi:hypothetical protein